MTLPALRDNALRRGTTIRITIATLDPTNDWVMKAYADFRNNRASAGWTPERARTEIYSSILAAAVYKNEAPRLEIEFSLSPSLWLLSIDVSDRVILVTGQNRGDSCLAIGRESELYQQWRDEMYSTYSGGRTIKPMLPGLRVADLPEPSEETLTSILAFFSDLGLPLEQDKARDVATYMARSHNYV
ncbi:hypothetical protein [Jannaschia sp. R86511]|uniref:hypothetical protein n=1 Tax=Jannaschia sp. R86511 TaxID=3093853 RepID=UPI0036D2CA19